MKISKEFVFLLCVCWHTKTAPLSTLLITGILWNHQSIWLWMLKQSQLRTIALKQYKSNRFWHLWRFYAFAPVCVCVLLLLLFSSDFDLVARRHAWESQLTGEHPSVYETVCTSRYMCAVLLKKTPNSNDWLWKSLNLPLISISLTTYVPFAIQSIFG